MLGSWLGSTWIHFVTCHEKCIFLQGICLGPSLEPLGSSFTHLQKLRFCMGGVRTNAWFLAWIHLEPLCYMSRDMYFLQGICLDPSVDPLGSSFTHLQKLRLHRRGATNAGFLAWIRLVPLGHPLRQICFTHTCLQVL